MYRLTIANLEHMVKEFEGSQDEKQQKLYVEAKRELARRKALLKGV